MRPYTFNVQPFLADKNLVQQGYVTSSRSPSPKAGSCSMSIRSATGDIRPTATRLSVWRTPSANVRRRWRPSSKPLHGGLEKLPAGSHPGNSLIAKANPQMGAEQIAFGIAQMKQYQLVTGGDAKTGGIGIITEPRLKKTWDMLVKNKLIDASKVPFEQTYTLEMVKDAGVMP
ncbi:hypothetical protein LNP26_23270 [Klebsiella variicola subsp. variicola]|nr:hypothetical protein [Klebsiella variicola subsp. variicola]